MLGYEVRVVQGRVACRSDRVYASPVVAPTTEQESASRSELRRRYFQRVLAAGFPRETDRGRYPLAVHDDLQAGRIGRNHVLGRNVAVQPSDGVDVSRRQFGMRPEGLASKRNPGRDGFHQMGPCVVSALGVVESLIGHDGPVVVRPYIRTKAHERMPSSSRVGRFRDVVAEYPDPLVTVPSAAARVPIRSSGQCRGG